MGLAQLYQKHEQDKKEFNELRDKVWAEMKEKHNQLIAAFQSKEQLPDDYSKQIDTELDNFRKDWATPNGIHYRAMEKEFQSQLKQYTPEIIPEINRATHFEKSLASTKAQQLSAQRVKHPEKFRNLDQNKDSMELGFS